MPAVMVAMWQGHYPHIYDKGGNTDKHNGSNSKSAVTKMPFPVTSCLRIKILVVI
jgi:hypothetical protein